MSNRRNKVAAVIRRDGERCAHCLTTENLTLDHIVPKSLGGSNRVPNLQLLCSPCNRRKGNRLDPRDVTNERITYLGRRLLGIPYPKHLLECDGVYCAFGCPIFHGSGNTTASCATLERS